MKNILIIDDFEEQETAKPFYETETKPFYLTNSYSISLDVIKSGKELRRIRRKKLRDNKNK